MNRLAEGIDAPVRPPRSARPTPHRATRRGFARPAAPGRDKGAFELGAATPALASGGVLQLFGSPTNAAVQLAGQQHLTFALHNRGDTALSYVALKLSIRSGLQVRGFSLIVDGEPRANGADGRSCRQTSTAFALCQLGTLAPGQTLTEVLTATRVGTVRAPLCSTGVASGGSPVQTVRAEKLPARGTAVARDHFSVTGQATLAAGPPPPRAL